MKDFVLPEGFATPDLGAVQGFLAANAGSAVQIDASRLRCLDTRLIELLLSAARAWKADAQAFRLVGLTPRHESILQRLDVSEDLLPRGAAA